MEEDQRPGEGGLADDAPEPAPRPSLRPSLRPSAGPSLPPPSGWAINYRIVFAAVWVLLQIALVLTADRRVDGAFGFRMFSESASLKVALFREVMEAGGGTTRVHVEEGVWTARSSDGTNHRLTWYDRVPAPFWVFDQEMHASYGSATQLGRLQAAVDDVAAHIPNDAETVRLVLQVTVRRNGREPVVHQLVSRPRPIAALAPEGRPAL